MISQLSISMILDLLQTQPVSLILFYYFIFYITGTLLKRLFMTDISLIIENASPFNFSDKSLPFLVIAGGSGLVFNFIRYINNLFLYSALTEIQVMFLTLFAILLFSLILTHVITFVQSKFFKDAAKFSVEQDASSNRGDIDKEVLHKYTQIYMSKSKKVYEKIMILTILIINILVYSFLNLTFEEFLLSVVLIILFTYTIIFKELLIRKKRLGTLHKYQYTSQE